MEGTSNNSLFDVIIVGGGVVGCSVLRSLTLAGYHACLIEAESDLLCHASGSNSGIICTGVDAPMGSLERALIRDSISQIRHYCQMHHVPYRPCGSLVCVWSHDTDDDDCKSNQNKSKDDNMNGLESVLEESHLAGDTEARRLDGSAQVHELEPNLHPSCCGAVHLPGEIVVDPWLLAISYAVHARENGATIYTGFELDPLGCQWDGHLWTLARKTTTTTTSSEYGSEGLLSSSSLQPPGCLQARVVINAAGVWADVIQSQAANTTTTTSTLAALDAESEADVPLHSPLPQPTWQSRPRRGQYRIFTPNPSYKNQSSDSRFLTHPIQPVPTQFTKGIFVFSTLYDQIVVGPTATDQDSRTDREVDKTVMDELDTYVQRLLPSLLSTHQVVGDYVGIRPATTDRDYQIHVYHQSSWITVAGIRSTGLTASLGIGRHVAHLTRALLPPTTTQQPSSRSIQTTPLPPINALVQNYRQRQDGKVCIHGHE